MNVCICISRILRTQTSHRLIHKNKKHDYIIDEYPKNILKLHTLKVHSKEY